VWLKLGYGWDDVSIFVTDTRIPSLKSGSALFSLPHPENSFRKVVYGLEFCPDIQKSNIVETLHTIALFCKTAEKATSTLEPIPAGIFEAKPPVGCQIGEGFGDGREMCHRRITTLDRDDARLARGSSESSSVKRRVALSPMQKERV